jgi:hypothetical protein
MQIGSRISGFVVTLQDGIKCSSFGLRKWVEKLAPDFVSK